MAIRKRTIRQMSPVARKLAKLVNEFQSTTRRLRHLLLDIQEIEYAAKVLSIERKEEIHVQPTDSRGFDPEDLSSRERSGSRHDEVGKPGHRRSTVRAGSKRRQRNKRWKQRKE